MTAAHANSASEYRNGGSNNPAGGPPGTTTGGSSFGSSPSHHLSDELLIDYATGSLDEAGSLFVAAHLTLCGDCRARLTELEAVGGALLAEAEPVEMSQDAFASLMTRIESEAINENEEQNAPNNSVLVKKSATARETAVLPAPLRNYLGADLDGVAWESKGGGVAVAPIPGFEASGQSVFLLKVEAGRAVPQHTHTGNEFVMVLTGGFHDATGHFGRGDVELADGDLDHQPIADEGEDCVCLAVTDAPLKFTGKSGWLLNLFVKM